MNEMLHNFYKKLHILLIYKTELVVQVTPINRSGYPDNADGC
jgi:hypothetical protein